MAAESESVGVRFLPPPRDDVDKCPADVSVLALINNSAFASEAPRPSLWQLTF